MLAGLHKHLHMNVVRDVILFDQPADKREFGIGSGWESDLDLLEASAYQEVKHFQLLLHAHWHGKRLIAVAEVDAAPDRGLGDGAVWPLAIGQIDGVKGSVFPDVVGFHKSRKKVETIENSGANK
jgi:hypothetical protein